MVRCRLIQDREQWELWQLIDRLEMVLADHVYTDGGMHQNKRTDSAKHLSSSLFATSKNADAMVRCRLIQDREQWELISCNSTNASTSYLLSVLCRVSLDPHVHLDAQRRTMIREDCIGRRNSVRSICSASDRQLSRYRR
jgi:hypothetical protein